MRHGLQFAVLPVLLLHDSDVIMSAIACQITGVPIISSTVCSAQMKENIKALRHWSLWWESTGDRFPCGEVITWLIQIEIGNSSRVMHYWRTWTMGISTVFQKPPTVLLQSPYGRHSPVVRTVQGDCERVYQFYTNRGYPAKRALSAMRKHDG